jgi:tetratricopeptide (TPR) repeat protein
MSGKRKDNSMSVSKKPRRKPPAATQAEASTDHALPDRRAMESYLATVAGGRRDDAIAKAQNVMYDAWDSTSSRSRVALARKALGISPLCADAYNLLAAEAATTAEARDLYARGLEAGELALGPKGFEEYDGHFWGFLETRPYMRARHGLALALLKLGEEGAAMEHFRAMLKLNPGDNQGIRYLLLGSLLRRDDIPALKTLLADYADEWSAYWLYTRALVAYREGQGSTPATLKLLKGAQSANEHVPAILAGAQPPMLSRSDYVTVGGADEAADYVRECGAGWQKTPGAIEWLTTALVGVSQTKRPASKAVH